MLRLLNFKNNKRARAPMAHERVTIITRNNSNRIEGFWSFHAMIVGE